MTSPTWGKREICQTWQLLHKPTYLVKWVTNLGDKGGGCEGGDKNLKKGWYHLWIAAVPQSDQLLALEFSIGIFVKFCRVFTRTFCQAETLKLGAVIRNALLKFVPATILKLSGLSWSTTFLNHLSEYSLRFRCR